MISMITAQLLPLSLTLLAAGAAGSCVSVEAKLLLPRAAPLCRDGRPLRILQHPDCIDGICGWSCLPDRWRDVTIERREKPE